MREKRTLDLQILAIENGGAFKESDPIFNEKLSRYHLGFKKGRVVRNICSHRYATYTVHLFDFSISAGDNSRSKEDMYCILIDLDNCRFPRFQILHKNIFNWLNFSGYAQLPKQLIPTWMPRTAFMFADKIDHLAVFSRMKYAESLKEIICMQNFEKMLFRSEYIAIYFQGELPADSDHYQQQLNLAESISGQFDPTSQLSAERLLLA